MENADFNRAGGYGLHPKSHHDPSSSKTEMAACRGLYKTLVLACNGILSPVFCSIEEWLGRNTEGYYATLAEVGQGRWNPSNNALPWVRFCLVAHYQQAATLMRRNNEFARVWAEIERVRGGFHLPDRMDAALMDATYGYKVRNNRYRTDNDISDVVASRDLKRLCDVGLLEPVGEKRGRYYIAAQPLIDIRQRLRDRTRAGNPYDLIRDRASGAQLVLPLEQLAFFLRASSSASSIVARSTRTSPIDSDRAGAWGFCSQGGPCATLASFNAEER